MDNHDTWELGPTPDGADETPSGKGGPAAKRSGPRRRTVGAAIAGSLLVVGGAGAVLVGPLNVLAASPSASPSAGTSSGTNPGDHGRGGFGGPHETVTDTSVVAAAIGISESDLITALQGGKTAAQVAADHNVDAQKVIDALVKDGLDELAAQVSAGSLTQAQADAMKAQVTQRATDQVNGTLMGGPGDHGRGGFGGPDNDNDGNGNGTGSTTSAG
jgi:hypothetical protein